MLHFSKGKKQRKENAVNANELLDSSDRALKKGEKEMETTLSFQVIGIFPMRNVMFLRSITVKAQS
ncbi:hypothetical protein P5G51_004225 [Virgibacillus sp. 179-BFC.A HS]|uniref:Uncharacterized protein n=1 Tax=Tigheibacillus jepli TaxID=3035914 RepID=A0ABU5CFT4_9BACI|nr:hypothetical protein [Virgibacillus sp. 179-BFC.A HS]MDY0404714.1 hypothetical protein [Virgibacillus sp. 179-BFC.A HS]